MAMDNATRMARDELMDKAAGSVELGGRRWPLKYGFAEITEFERLSGVSVLQVASMMLALRVDTIVKGLWVVMRQQKPKITERKICGMLDREPGRLKVCLEEFVAAILQTLPLDEEDEDEEGTAGPLAGGDPDSAGIGTAC